MKLEKCHKNINIIIINNNNSDNPLTSGRPDGGKNVEKPIFSDFGKYQ